MGDDGAQAPRPLAREDHGATWRCSPVGEVPAEEMLPAAVRAGRARSLLLQSVGGGEVDLPVPRPAASISGRTPEQDCERMVRRTATPTGGTMMTTGNSTAVDVARAHIDAWSHHDWERTRELLAPGVHAWVTSTQAGFGTAELAGIDAYMEPKVKAARLIEPGSVREICAMGDERNALVIVTFRIGLGPGGSVVTMARSCLYLLDEDEKIKEERDTFYVLPAERA